MKKRVSSAISFSCIFTAAILAGALIFYANGGVLKEYEELEKVSSVRIPQKHLAWIEVDFGQGKRRVFQGEVGSDTYAFLPALLAVAERGGFRIEISKGRIAQIAGTPATWTVYHNEKTVGTNIDSLIIQAGDRYAIRRE